MSDDVRRLREFRKSAVYLCGHGPYREPRLLDVQYLRILRYADALSTKLSTTFQGRRAYVDPNFPREKYYDELPALQSLCEAVRAGQYEVVFIDIRWPQHFNEPNIHASVRHHLKQAGAVVYNAYGDDEQAMADMLEARWGKEARFAVPRGDEDDIVCLFPALAAHVAEEALLRDLDREEIGREYGPYGLDENARRRVQTLLRSLATDNPYQSDWIPLFSDYRRDVVHYRVGRAREERNAERRKTETLYLIDREKPPLLIDEGIDYNRKPRDEAGLTWAAERLAVLGFTREEHERVVVFSRELNGLELCADPRQTKALLFRAYAPRPPEPAKKRRGPKPSPLAAIEFHLLDSAKNDLPGQFVKALRTAISARAHYDKRYRGAPWMRDKGA